MQYGERYGHTVVEQERHDMDCDGDGHGTGVSGWDSEPLVPPALEIAQILERALELV
jgi:hypothetical protein